MKEKLIAYGFSKEQVTRLLKNKKLDTVHGLYILKGCRLTLEQDGNTRQIEL